MIPTFCETFLLGKIFRIWTSKLIKHPLPSTPIVGSNHKKFVHMFSLLYFYIDLGFKWGWPIGVSQKGASCIR